MSYLCFYLILKNWIRHLILKKIKALFNYSAFFMPYILVISKIMLSLLRINRHPQMINHKNFKAY